MDTTLTPIRGNVLHFTKTVGFPKHVTLPLPRNAFKAVSRRTIGRKREDDALRENFTTFRRISRKTFIQFSEIFEGSSVDHVRYWQNVKWVTESEYRLISWLTLVAGISKSMRRVHKNFKPLPSQMHLRRALRKMYVDVTEGITCKLNRHQDESLRNRVTRDAAVQSGS